ncbi:MAG: hypothetical protein Q8N03_12125 [Ignavibacteria bacterium]|nr:hypothetical protein [Ignavibacteria bacterium]
MKVKILVIMLGLIFVSKINAQDQVSLLEMDKVKEYLTLNADQYKTINAKVVQIKEILEEDKETIAALKARFKSGDEPGFFEKIKVKRARDNRVDKINDLLDDIEKQLNSGQKNKFKNIAKPGLKALNKKELAE